MQTDDKRRDNAPTDTRKTQPAGPHASEKLTDREKTPGTGALPEKDQPEVDVGPD